MAIFSTMTRRLSSLSIQRRLSSRSVASASYKGFQRFDSFLFAAVPIILLSSISCASSAEYPTLPPIVTAAEGSSDPSAPSDLTALAATFDISIPSLLASFGPLISNLLITIEELLTGGFLIPQTEPPIYGSPLGGIDSEIKTLAVQERSLLITEIFRVHGLDGPYCEVKRAKGWSFLFSRKDKMRFYVGRELVATLESTRHSHVYNVLRGNTDESIGRIEKSKDDTTSKDKFEFYSAEPPITITTNSEQPTTIKPAYTLVGDFIDRRFVMKNGKSEVVAKIKKQVIAIPAFDHFDVRIAPGMDPILVLACVCVVDEELDEELQDKVNSAARSSVVAVGSIVGFIGNKVVAFFNPFD